jgi:hypothetical protein
MKTEKNMFGLGGRAIASGGFGCVFLPPLKCKGVARPTGKIVSKLLTTNNALDEFQEAEEIQTILKTNLSLDTYNRYFIFPEKLCEPEALTKDDLVNFEKKCKNLTKAGITSSNINQKLYSVGILELVNGGSDLATIIKGMKTMTDLSKLNKNIIELLTNAIVPMNRLGILHFDLKSPNILADDDSQLRIIDWGLSVISKNNKIPSGSTSRPIQYNLPFSTVLFNKKITNDIDSALKKMIFDANYKETIKPELSAIIHNIVVKQFSNSDRGHIQYVSGHLKQVFNITGERDFFIYNLLSNYLTEAVINFINPQTKTFDDTKYFNDVCAKNCDIWGLITVYDDIVTHYESFLKKIPDDLKRLRLLVIRYLYSPEFAGKPIDITNLVDELKDIIPFSGEIKKTNGTKKASKLVETKKNNIIDLTKMDSNNSPRKNTNVSKSADAKKNGVANFVFNDSDVSSSVKIKTKTKTKRNKRCKNGTRRNKKTGECEGINGVPKQFEQITSQTPPPPPSTPPPTLSPIPTSLLERFGIFTKDVKNIEAVKKPKVVIGEKKTRKRCKNGTRRNKKTGKCEGINRAQELTPQVASANDEVVTPQDQVASAMDEVASAKTRVASLQAPASSENVGASAKDGVVTAQDQVASAIDEVASAKTRESPLQSPTSSVNVGASAKDGAEPPSLFTRLGF